MLQQKQLKSLLTQTLFTSLAPLAVYALLSVFEQTLFSQDRGVQNERSLCLILLKTKSIILQAYSSFISFSLLMIALNAIYKAGWTLFSKKSDSFENISCLPSTLPKENHFQGKSSQRILLFTILSYGAIYLSFRLTGSTFGFLDDNPSSQIPLIPRTTGPFTGIDGILTARTLEQRQEESFALTESPQFPIESDLKTLSIGKTLSFLNTNPAAILLSKTGKLAYVITRYYGSLKIIDLSDHQYPTIIGSLDLAKIDLQYRFKTLKLSADEKTLFATTTERLEIINVTNPKSPSHISFLISSTIPYINTPSYFLPTLALSPDETILYVAGLGLQIYNVADLFHPKLIFSARSPQVDLFFTVTSLALLPGGNALAYANNTLLEFYDVSDPANPKRTNSYKAKISINSILLSRNSQATIYAAGFLLGSKDQVMLEKINIQDSLSPQSIDLYDLKNDSTFPPCIMGISPNETNIFVSQVVKKGSLGYVVYVDMIAYDLLKKQVMTQSKSLFSRTMTIAMVPQSNHILVGSQERFGILEFSKNYPNTRAFCRFDNTNKSVQFPSVKLLESSGSKTWFTLSADNMFSSYNMTNEDSSQKLGSYQFPDATLIQRISLTQNRAFVHADADIIVFNSSSGLTPLGSLLPKTSSYSSVEDLKISNSENIAYVIQKDARNTLKLSAINFTNFSSITLAPFVEITTETLFSQIVLPKNRQDLLFLLLDRLHIFNISNPMAPVLLASQLVVTSGDSSDIRVLSLTFSQDVKVLFVLMFDMGSSYTLRILDISNLTDIKLIQALALPRIAAEPGRRPFILSNDMKKGFVITDVNLLVIDLRNLTSPTILGVIPLGLIRGEDVQNFFLSPDETIGYIHTLNRVVKINLGLTYSLYLPQENFFIGKKYSDSVMFLSSHQDDFLLMSPADYKIIKLSLFNLQVSPSQNSPLMTYTSLPSWINFDSENQILTIESKRQRDLGSYTLYSISSKEIPLKAFESVLNNSLPSEDMVTLLISLGYVDNQRFLTANFGLEKNFLLPSQYAGLKDKIFQTLQSYRIETFTDFNILPSLRLSTESTTSGKLSIKSTSISSVEVEIKLLDSKTQFLQKTYGTVLPLITENKSRLKIEGSLENINKALRELVINTNNTGAAACQGEIIINDNLNPPISQTYTNISEYFFHNDAPTLNPSHNLTLEQQIDSVRLYTGQYFSINLDPSTFKDRYSESLTYALITKEDGQEDDTLPSWLSFQGLTLKGTPPEEIFKRQFKFELIIKNEFKQIEIPMVLNIRISWQFVGKLLMRFSPYILTAIGLVLTANKIANVLLKKRYRHAKEFYVKVGQEINSSIIFPIRFIAEDKLEGDLILRYLNRKKALLIDNGTELKTAIKEAIEKMPAKEKQQLHLYSSESSQKRVYQYIQHELVMWQLNSSQEKETKNSFDNIKDKWVDLIEYQDSLGFTLNENNFKAFLGEKQTDNNLLSESLNDSLLIKNDALNINLLKKALVVHATKNHELNFSHAKLDILVHLQTPRSGIFKFLKQDLERIKYSDKGILVYGLAFHIQKDTLEITGTLDESFARKVLVVQIVNNHQRILKEIWIHGVPDIAKDRENLSYMSESQAKGKEYGVF